MRIIGPAVDEVELAVAPAPTQRAAELANGIRGVSISRAVGTEMFEFRHPVGLCGDGAACHDAVLGKLVFRQEHPFQRIFHNETANAIQRRLQWEGITTVILPVRVNL